MLGTVAYMSPEQVRAKELDARTDLFSFGAVLYEMATGQLPFRGETSASSSKPFWIATPTPAVRLNPEVPPKLEDIIGKALEKDRELRYQHASDMRADLKRLKRESESGNSAAQEEAAISSRWLARPRSWVAAAVVIVVLGAGYAGFHWYGRRPAPAASAEATKPSVAVLPLRNLSGDAANDYFSDGMSEEISTKLSRIHALTVAPYSSTARLKAEQKSPQEIARELNVRYLLDGSVRKAGDQVKVNVRLFDATNGTQAWADDFVGEMKDVFSLQEQTALKIAQALNVQLSPQEQQAVKRRYTQNAQAYEEFLIGRSLVVYGDSAAWEAARRHFEAALKLDPNYAPALAGLSQVEQLYYRDVDSNPENLRRAEQFVKQALAIDPQLPEAHVALGRVLGAQYYYPDAAREFRLATESEPDNANAWDMLSWALAYQTPPQPVEAEKAAREAIRLDPALAYAQYHLGRALYMQNRFPEAMAAFARCEEISGNFGLADMGRAQSLAAQNRYAEALVAMLKRGKPANSIGWYWLSSFYAGNGDKEKALATLQKALELGFRDFAAIDANPAFTSLRGNPSFQQLLSRYRH